MLQSPRPSLTAIPAMRDPERALPQAGSLLGQALLGVFAVALVAVLSLPQARSFDAGIGWVPFWLLAMPASAWCALWAAGRWPTRRAVPAAVVQPRRLGPAPARRRGVAGFRLPRRARAA